MRDILILWALVALALAMGCSPGPAVAPGACADSKNLAAAEDREARAQAILEKVNAPLGKLRQGMTYEEVVEVLQERQNLIDQDEVLQRMRWKWSAPQHRFTIAHGDQTVTGVSSFGFLFVLIDDCLENVIGLSSLREASGAASSAGQVAAARAMAQRVLLVPAISMADVPIVATNGARSSVQRALGPPEFPPEIVVALAPLVVVTEIQEERNHAVKIDIMDQYNAIGIGLGTDSSALRKRWGPAKMGALNARGEQLLTFTSPVPPGSSIVTEIEVDVVDGKVKALYSGQRYVKQSGK